MKSRAFTLIELLVVIAIIAILAAILFPVFAQAKLAAKKTVDLSNVKQLALGVTMYQNDADDMAPYAWYQNDGQGYWDKTFWTAAIYPYVKNGASRSGGTAGAPQFDGKRGGLYESPGAPPVSGDQQPQHYGVNEEIFGSHVDPGLDDRHESATTAVLGNPASKMMITTKGVLGEGSAWPALPALYTAEWFYFGDTNDHRQDDLLYDVDLVKGGAYDGYGRVTRYRYSGVANVAFMDGHAKGMKKGSMSGPENWCKYLYGDRPSIFGNWTYPYPTGIFDGNCTKFE